MGWLLDVIWELICLVLEHALLGAKHDWVKEEVDSEPKSDVL